MMLNPYQKRQATLLYYFASMAYLDTIIERVRALTAFTDTTLDYAQRVARDKIMRQRGWKEEHLSSNWSTHAHPMLQDCLRGLLSQKALRVTESYDISGVRSTLTGMDHFSMNWTLPEEEIKFRELGSEARAVGNYLDKTISKRWHDYDMTWVWTELHNQFSQLPKYRVRTDVVAESGKRPIRTGVYVPENDEFGTLQFAWTGDSGGALTPSETLSGLAREYANEVGRDRLWTAPDSEKKVPGRVEFTDEYFDDWCRNRKHMNVPDTLSSRNPRAFTSRPCKWFYVEKIEGEFEETDQQQDFSGQRIRCEPGSVVPKTGWWHSPAIQGEGALRYFEAGTKFPELSAIEWGAVFWQYEPDHQTVG
jgi:hypothetical protein